MISEGYPGKSPYKPTMKILLAKVSGKQNILLTPARHTYQFTGWKEKIIHRLLTSGQYSVEAKTTGTYSYDVMGQDRLAEFDEAYGRYGTAESDRVDTAKDDAFNKGIHLGLFTTYETHTGTYIPKTDFSAITMGVTKHALTGGLGHIWEAGAKVVETINQAKDGKEILDRVTGAPAAVYHDGQNLELIRRRHFNNPKSIWYDPTERPKPQTSLYDNAFTPGTATYVKNFIKRTTGMGEQEVMVVLSLLPGRNMLQLSAESSVKLYEVADYLNAMDPTLG